MNDLQEMRPIHRHTGTDSPRLDPKFFLPLPFYSTIPDVSVAPHMFIYDDGAGDMRLYVKHAATLYYTALT